MSDDALFAVEEDSEEDGELSEEELAGYGVDKQKRKSAFWSQAALRILTDRKPAEVFMPEDDEDSDSDL